MTPAPRSTTFSWSLMLRWLAAWLARRQGMELHYPERADPPLEAQGTNANDGTPCARAPVPPTTYRRAGIL